MKKRILIADDNPTNLYLLETLLTGEGFEVTSAVNGKEALEKAVVDPPDLIITDVLMPVMDGFALCKQWKSDDKLKNIPFVIYTATYSGADNEDFALGLGADRFILKPQEPEVLLGLLEEMLKDNYHARQVDEKPLEEEIGFFKQYNEILFRKLEKKMSDLETANETLKTITERYRLSFQNVSDVIYMTDADLKILDMSPSVERIMGYKPEEFIGRYVTDLAPVFKPGDLEQAIKDIDLVLKGQSISSRMYEFIARDGSVRVGEVNASPIMQDDSVVGMIAVARDVTDRKQAEDKLKESERLYRELYDFLPIPAYEMDFDANLTFVNRAIYEVFRATEEDFKKGFKAWQLLSEGDVEKSRGNIERLLRGEQVGGTEYTLTRLDGSVFPAIVVSSLICRDGKPVGLRGVITDITARKRAEDELRRSEEKYRLLFDNASEAILVVQGGVIKFANRATFAISGYPEGRLISKPFSAFIHPADHERVYEYYRKRIAGEEVPANYTFRVETRDGSVKWVAIHAALIDWEGKAATLNFLSDITEKKRAEEALEAERTLLRNLIDNVPDRIYAKDRESRFIVCNEAMIRRMGLTSMNEIVGKSDFELLPREMAERFRADELKVIQSGVPIVNREEPLEIEDGRITRWNLATKAPLLDGSGNRVGIVGVGREITDLKLAEEALRRSEARFRSYFELPLIGIAITSPEKGWLEGNERLSSILGYSWEELKKLTWSELTYPGDLAADEAQFNRVLAGEIDGYMLEKRFIRKGGAVIWTSVAAGCVRKENGAVDYFVALVEDITERKESVNRLRKSLGATVQAMAVTVETRDPYTAGHQRRVSDLARAIATEMGLSTDQIEGIRMAAVIHDIGKLSVPSELLSMPRKLTDVEFSLIKIHAQSGYDILKDIEFPWPIARMVLEHHERMDGSGYPQGLTGEGILLESRIISVADVVEAMASHRPYRPTVGLAPALDEISGNRGTRYDPDAVDACLRLFREKRYRLAE
jgi:PAS domain S-box-containing protein